MNDAVAALLTLATKKRNNNNNATVNASMCELRRHLILSVHIQGDLLISLVLIEMYGLFKIFIFSVLICN